MKKIIANLTEQLSIKEKEELCKYIQAQYCVEFKPMCKDIIEILSKETCVDIDDITKDTPLEELGISSLNLLYILSLLENNLKINIDSYPYNDDEVITVADIINLFKDEVE